MNWVKMASVWLQPRGGQEMNHIPSPIKEKQTSQRALLPSSWGLTIQSQLIGKIPQHETESAPFPLGWLEKGPTIYNNIRLQSWRSRDSSLPLIPHSAASDWPAGAVNAPAWRDPRYADLCNYVLKDYAGNSAVRFVCFCFNRHIIVSESLSSYGTCAGASKFWCEYRCHLLYHSRLFPHGESPLHPQPAALALRQEFSDR